MIRRFYILDDGGSARVEFIRREQHANRSRGIEHGRPGGDGNKSTASVRSAPAGVRPPIYSGDIELVTGKAKGFLQLSAPAKFIDHGFGLRSSANGGAGRLESWAEIPKQIR